MESTGSVTLKVKSPEEREAEELRSRDPRIGTRSIPQIAAR
jgi:hypothetical protein